MIPRFATSGILVLALSLLSCGSDLPLGDGDDPPDQPKVSNPFTLRFGETAIIDPGSVEVTFTRLVSDSRCPSDVLCIWEGEAVIELRFVVDLVDTHLVNATVHGGGWQGGWPPLVTLDTLGYRIALLDLDPYPVSTITIPDSERVATLGIFLYSPPDTTDGVVQITDWAPAEIQKDYWDLMGLGIDGDQLVIAAGYSGCQPDHGFDLYMSPAAFLESMPAQANIYLRHDQQGELCERYMTRSLRFDLLPMAQYYEVLYGQLDCMLLNLYHYNPDGPPILKSSILYHPTGAGPSPPCDAAVEASGS